MSSSFPRPIIQMPSRGAEVELPDLTLRPEPTSAPCALSAHSLLSRPNKGGSFLHGRNATKCSEGARHIPCLAITTYTYELYRSVWCSLFVVGSKLSPGEVRGMVPCKHR